MADNIGKLIKQRRERLGLTQEELAKKLGYKGKSSINKIELGIVDVPRAKVPAFASALGVTPQELTGWTDDHAQASFSYCLEQQMRILGYELIYDADGNMILTHNGIEYEVTKTNIKELEKRLTLYMDFLLNDLSKNSRKIDD